MKTLSLIVLAGVTFGALALSGCSGCSQQDMTTDTGTAAPQITCGPGTRQVGSQCVGNAASTTNRPTTLSTTGNN